MAVAAGAAARARRLRLARPDGWTVAGVCVAALVAVPLLTLPASFLSPRVGAWWDVTSAILPATLVDTLVVAGGVAVGAAALGGSLAVLISFYDFPGRRLMDPALILPLALPGYVLTFVFLRQLDYAGPVQSTLRDLFGPGFALPLRSPGGAVAILTLTLYPYAYLLARAAFREQSPALIEAARSLGAGRLRAIVRVALPMARPALAAGAILAVMEALADFGTVQLLGVRTFTVAIYQVWFGAFDRLAAMQLATMLMALMLTLLVLERLMRGRARFDQVGGRSGGAGRVSLRGWRGLLAAAFPLAVLALAFAGPLAQLAVWSLESIGEPLVRSGFGTWLRNSVLLGAMAAVIGVGVGLLLVLGLRAAPSRAGALAARVASLGYGVPGSVVAVGAIIPLAWLDDRINDVGSLVGAAPRLLLTGTALGLIFAYVVRFLALAMQSLEAQLARLSPNLEAAARTLGADRLETIWRVNLPLMRLGILVAALLVFVETIKELPATVLLRPFGGETLAVAVWQSTSESLWEAAALPALAIVAVGIVPVVLLMRVLERAAPAAA